MGWLSSESGQPPLLEIGYIHVIRLQFGFLLSPFLGLSACQFL